VYTDLLKDMKRNEMTEIVNAELKHIPSDVDVPQKVLRYLYNMARRRDLTKEKTKEETLLYCIDVVKKNHPAWTPKYDQSYFLN